MTRRFHVSLGPGVMPRDIEGVPGWPGALPLSSVARSLNEEQVNWLKKNRPDLIPALSILPVEPRAPKEVPVKSAPPEEVEAEPAPAPKPAPKPASAGKPSPKAAPAAAPKHGE